MYLIAIVIFSFFTLLILFGVVYDFFIRKSFKEMASGPVNQNAEQAKRDAKTNEASNFNGFGQ